MTDSAPLAAAHHRPRARTATEREAGLAWGLWIHLVRWIITAITGLAARSATTEPEPETSRQHAPRAAASDDRHARMALAVAGAQRARTERRAPASDFVLDWERRFDAARPVAGPASGRLVGGAAWA